MGSTSALWVRQQFGLAEQFPLSTAGANKAANVGRRPTLHILPRCTRPLANDRRPIEGRSKADRRPINGRSTADRRPIEGKFCSIETPWKPDWMPIKTRWEADQHLIWGKTSVNTH